MKKTIIPLLLLSLLCGCAKTEAVPELLEPVKVETDKAVALYSEIYNITMYEATIKPEVQGLGFTRFGRVEECYYSVGDVVRAGDIIAVLDTRREQDEAEALLFEIESLTQNNDIERRRSELEIGLLRSAGQFSLNQVEIELKNTLEQQRAEKAELEISELEERLAEVEQSIADSALTAEYDGTIISMTIKSGGFVREDAEAVYIADDSTMKIVTDYIRGENLARADRIYASIGGIQFDVTNIPYERSELISLSAMGADLRSTFIIDEPTEDIHNGMFTCIYVRENYVENALVIPSIALKKDSIGTFVYLVTDDGQKRRDVETGVQTDALIEVLSGLEEGDVVFVGS